MAVVEVFDETMLEQYLITRNYDYIVVEGGRMFVELDHDDDLGCALSYSLEIDRDTEGKKILGVYIGSSTAISRADWGRIIYLCNKWNKEQCWPKAYLEVGDAEVDQTSFIQLEQSINLGPGVHQELLDQWIDDAITGGYDFWEWAHQEHGV